MIAFQNIKSGKYMSRLPIGRDFETTTLLADAIPYATDHEDWLRRTYLGMDGFRTVTYSSRIDHPANDIANLGKEQLAERHSILPACMPWGNRGISITP